MIDAVQISDSCTFGVTCFLTNFPPQARKEEMWEVAKREGAAGDKQSDTHYVKNVAGAQP